MVRTLALDEPGASPVTIASNLDFTTDPVVGSDGDVYWADNLSIGGPGGTLVGAPLTGGATKIVAMVGPTALATFGDVLYYADVSVAGTVLAMPLGGGTSVQFAPPPEQLEGELLEFLLADTQHVFAFDHYSTASGDQGLVRAYAR
jgi:hypothetical protein